MFVLVFLLALGGVCVCGHMAKNDALGLQPEQMPAERGIVMDENGMISELHRSLTFYPSNIDFGAWSVGTAKSHIVTLVNTNTNRSVYLSSISGKTPAFYSSFFEDKVVPPQGNTTFNVVFLPRSYGKVETNLMIHTSFGQAKLSVRGEGKECPYRLQPLVGIKAPFNATISPEIHMYNPHTKPIQILEIYSSGGQFQLELPSGGQEGPQALWEIPPHTTKPIIRIKFHGTQPGNHTAYIRIKISGSDEDREENVLVIPVEFEILGHHGVYSSNPVIDFGRMTAMDGNKLIKLNLTNSGKEKVQVLDYRLHDVQNLIEFRRSNFTLTLNVKYAKQNVTVINGELLIKSQTKQSPRKKMEYTVPIRAEIYKGSLHFNRNTTVFLTKAKNYTKIARTFFIRNSFAVPVVVSNIFLEDNDTSVVKISAFKPGVTIGPGERIPLFKIGVVNETANFITPLRIVTNITTQEFPVIVCTGLLKRHTSIDSENLSRLPDSRVLDYGVVQIGEQSPPGLILLHNPNPIPIQLLRWNFTNPREVYYQSMFLGCLKKSYRANTTAAEKFNFCLNLPAWEVAAFQLIVESYTVKTFNGVFKIWTEFEEVHTKVKFASLLQRLEVDQSKIHLKDCFPGKRCSAGITIHSTFVKPLKISSFHVSVPGLVIESQTPNRVPEIAPNAITDVGYIHFDPKSVCLKKCFLMSEDDEEVPKQPGLYFDLAEVNRRKEVFRRFKESLKQITFTLNTNDVRMFEFNTTVDIIWPKLVAGVQKFPAIEVGQMYNGIIFVRNPTTQPIAVEFNLVDPKRAQAMDLHNYPPEVVEPCEACYLTDKTVYFLEENGKKIIEPKGVIGVQVHFAADDAGTFSTLLEIRNNITVFEGVWITAKAVQPQFRFGNRKPGSQTPILFEINERHLATCEEENESKEFIIISTKRTLTARNTGEVPIFVETFMIGDRACEGYGFKIVDCSSFVLYVNASRKVDIVFTPDFTMTRVSRPLVLRTNLTYAVNYTLLATMPRHSVEKCASVSSRPDWEEVMKKCSVGMLSVAFISVLVSSFFDSDKVLKDHVQNLSKEKGPVQPPLDLRNIALKSSSRENSPTGNGSVSQEKIALRNSTVTVRKRNSKRNSFGSQILASKEKSWAEELAKKIGSSSKKNEPTNNNNGQILSAMPNGLSAVTKSEDLSPSGSKNSKPKEDKQISPPKKSLPKEKDQIENALDKGVVEKPTIPENERKDVKLEVHQIEIKKPKISFKKIKPAPVSHNAIQIELPKDKSETNSVLPATNASNSPERPVEKSQKSQKQVKEKLDLPERKADQSQRRLDNKVELTEKRTDVTEKKSFPTQTEPAKSPTHNHITEFTTQTETSPPAKHTNSTKKYGKTPGRERKKDQSQSKRSERKSAKYKGNAFQFSAPLQPSLNSTGNVWDPNQASFSHVVAQKTLDLKTDTMTRKAPPSSMLEQPDEHITEHDWNEADLKNHETFGPDADIKTNSVDLGPIGTKKSPSSTPVWEPLPPPMALPRPTPNMPSANSSFFSSNFPIASNLEYSNDNQYLGGASGLLDHLITESQQQRRWHTNEILLSLLHQRDRNATRNDWEMENHAWTPMGYQSNTSAVLSDSLDVWQTGATTIRPPPGLGGSKTDSPNQRSHTSSSSLSHDENIEPIQPFDPFSSLSSIWSETWTKKNQNN